MILRVSRCETKEWRTNSFRGEELHAVGDLAGEGQDLTRQQEVPLLLLLQLEVLLVGASAYVPEVGLQVAVRQVLHD